MKKILMAILLLSLILFSCSSPEDRRKTIEQSGEIIIWQARPNCTGCSDVIVTKTKDKIKIYIFEGDGSIDAIGGINIEQNNRR